MENSKQPAFPVPSGTAEQNGLTKREYFAANEDIPYDFVIYSLSKKIGTDKELLTTDEIIKHRAELKCHYADELLKQLESK